MPRHLFPSSASKPWLRSNPPYRSGFTRGRSLWATTPRQQAQNCVFGQYESHLCPTIDGSVKEAAACAPLHQCLRQNHSRSTRGLRYLEPAESCGSQCTHTHTDQAWGYDHWQVKRSSLLWWLMGYTEHVMNSLSQSWSLKSEKMDGDFTVAQGPFVIAGWLRQTSLQRVCSGSAAMEVLSGGRLVPVWRAVVTFWAVFCRNLGCW